MFDKGKVAAGKTIEIAEEVSMFDVGKEPEKLSRRFADSVLVVESPPELRTPDRKIGMSTELMTIHSSPTSASSTPSHESALSPGFLRKFYNSSPTRASPESTPSTSSSIPALSTVLDPKFFKKINFGVPKSRSRWRTTRTTSRSTGRTRWRTETITPRHSWRLRWESRPSSRSRTAKA